MRDEDWMKSMLRHCLFCTVATVSNGRAFMRPSAFYYDPEDHAIFIYGAHQGRSFENAQENSDITVCVYDVGAMRVHERAFDFFQEHAGVIIFGTASPVTDNNNKHLVMRNTFAKHTPHLKEGQDYQSASQVEIDETSILRIAINEWSGKLKWTREPERKRYKYDDVIGENKPNLPWHFEIREEDAANAEWRASFKKNTS